MNLIILLAVGGILGWVASMLVGGGGGILMNIVVGIVGALVAGFLLNPLIGGGNIMTGDLSMSAILVSLLGSIVLLLVLNLIRRGDRSIAQVARDLGVSHWTLRGWVQSAHMAKRLKKGSGKATPADPATESPQQRIERLERENERLRKENDSLRTDRSILKKAAAFFAKESE